MSRPTLIYPGVTVSGGGAVTSEYLRVADGTELGTSGKALDDGTETIALVIDSGQAAAPSGGLDGLIGAVYWDLGAVSQGNINTLLTWVTRLPATHVVVAAWRSTSAPTSLADIDAASAHWSQLYQSGTNRSSTYLKTGTQNLGTTNSENFVTSVSSSLTVATDGDGYGGSLVRHDGSGTSKVRTLATAFAQASGNFYVALLWGKSATASSEEVIKVKLQGEMLQ